MPSTGNSETPLELIKGLRDAWKPPSIENPDDTQKIGLDAINQLYNKACLAALNPEAEPKTIANILIQLLNAIDFYLPQAQKDQLLAIQQTIQEIIGKLNPPTPQQPAVDVRSSIGEETIVPTGDVVDIPPIPPTSPGDSLPQPDDAPEREIRFTQYELVRELVAKKSNLSREQINLMSKEQLVDFVFDWAFTLISAEITEESAVLAKTKVMETRFTNIKPGQGVSYKIEEILKDSFGDVEGQLYTDQLSALAWSINAGVSLLHPDSGNEPTPYEHFQSNPASAPEYYRVGGVLGNTRHPMIIPANMNTDSIELSDKIFITEADDSKDNGEEILNTDNIERLSFSAGEIVRQAVKWNILRFNRTQLKETHPDYLKEDNFPHVFTQGKEMIWRQQMVDFVVDALVTGSDEANKDGYESDDEYEERLVQYRERIKRSAFIKALPAVVANFMESLGFRLLFDTSALKFYPDSQLRHLNKARGKLREGRFIGSSAESEALNNPNFGNIQEDEERAKAQDKVRQALTITISKGSTGAFPETIESFVAPLLIAAEKYLLEFRIKEGMSPEAIRQCEEFDKQRKTLIGWILSNIPADKIPMTTKGAISTPGERLPPNPFGPGAGVDAFGYPTNMASVEWKNVVDAKNLQKLIMDGFDIDFLKLLRYEERAGGKGRYAWYEPVLATKLSGTYRSNIYYPGSANSFEVSPAVFAEYYDVWYSDDPVVAQRAITERMPFPVKGYKRDPATGEIKLREIDDPTDPTKKIREPIVTWFLTYIPTHMVDFFIGEPGEKRLQKKLDAKEITRFEFEYLKNLWKRVMDPNCPDQLEMMYKIIYELIVYAQIKRIPNDAWTQDHSDAFLLTHSYEYFLKATRTPAEILTLGRIRGPQKSIVEMARSLVFAKREERFPVQEFMPPSIQGLFPIAESRRLDGPGMWTHEEAVNILLAAGKVTARKPKAK
jgi:hypothetical protein